ncbi:class I SAM-dependent methyltransferase [Saccharomonospora sp. NPDC006951]
MPPAPDSRKAPDPARAKAFGAKAAEYAQHRPGYPVRALRFGLAGATGAVRNVLDLGAGTGKLTAGLSALVPRVTAVEPDEHMLAQLRLSVPEVTALAGTAEDIPAGDATMDAVFAGQAFHWFDGEKALTEIARVLRPGGALVALWNDDDPECGWLAELTELINTSVRSRRAPEPIDIPSHGDFGPFERASFPHSQRRTAETMLATLRTHSHFLVADEPRQRDMLARAAELLASYEETADGEFDRPLITSVLRATRH